MITKLKKILKNKKFLDIFSYIFCAIYFIFVFCYALNNVLTINNYENEFNNLLNYANSYNQKISNHNFFNQTNKENIVNAEPLFSDGKTALISAFNKTMNSNSFYVETTGTMSTNTIGIDVKVATHIQVVRYSNNKIYECRSNKLLETNAGSLLGIVENNSNKCTKVLKDNSVFRGYKTDKVSFVNNIPVGNYSGTPMIHNPDTPLLSENLYVINENTIKEITYFSVKYKDGLPVNYFVQAELDTKKAVEKYGAVLKQCSGALEDPVFNKCLITAVIDAYGYVTGLTTIDNCVLVMDILGGVTCPCVFTQTYAFSGIGETMTFVPEGF